MISRKRPPDKYTTIKCSLKNIIKNEDDKNIILNAVTRTNRIIIHTYQFLRLFILKKYNANEEIPLITKDVIRMAFKALTKNTKKPIGENLRLLSELNLFYETEYNKFSFHEKISAIHLTQILNVESITMITAIENNIKLNFVKYVRRFVNSYFKKQNNEELEKTKSTKEKKIVFIELKKEMAKIKNDLLNRTQTASNKYQEWINHHKSFLFPDSYKNVNNNDISSNPQKYLKNMIYMCHILETNKTKMFQFFPLRTEITPKYISIDTHTIIDLFIENSNDYYSKISECKNELWKQFFNIKDKLKNHYVFDYKISTDGFAVSLQLLHESYVNCEKEKKKRIQEKNKKEKQHINTLNEEEKIIHKKEKDKKKLQNKENERLKKQEKKDKFKKLPKEEQLKIINELKVQKNSEFPYLEELNDDQLNELKNTLKVYCDPGKRNLLYMMDDNGRKLRYSNNEKLHNTKYFKYNKILENHKRKNNITIIENELSNYNSKSCDLNPFTNFIVKKNEINEKLYTKYEEGIFRKYKWFSYINKQKEDQNIINKIINVFGKNIKMIYGDWSIGQQMKNYIPTPNIRLKRNIGRHFDTYSLYEFRTSLLNYKTEERNDNLFLIDKTNKTREIHSILTYKMENKRMGCINRDYNAVNNYKKITEYYLDHKDRPEKYKKSYKFD